MIDEEDSIRDEVREMFDELAQKNEYSVPLSQGDEDALTGDDVEVMDPSAGTRLPSSQFYCARGVEVPEDNKEG